jgi:hypothetical protein
MRCKNCIYFERGKWHKVFGGEEQLSGKCELLLKTLKINNSELFFIEALTVQESFGCVLGKGENGNI